jgi:myo-inositol-1(or 4)-monophosphatase
MVIKNSMNVPLFKGQSLSDKIGRDYMEIENLQSSFNGTSKFVINLLNMLREEFIKYFEKTRYDFGFEYNNEIIRKSSGENKIIVYIDGLINIFHSVPYFCIAIALQNNDKIISGIIDNPITQETFIVEENKGAFVNTRRIRVSKRSNLNECIIAGINITTNSPLLDSCYVASGKYDAAIIKKTKLSELALLLLRESGAFLQKETTDTITITNNIIKI